MTKKTIYRITIIVNIILAIVFAVTLMGAIDNLKFEYVEQETIGPDNLRSYLDRENYGVAASLSHSIRGGAEVAKEYEDYYRLGEYADILFLKEVFAKAGNTDTLAECEKRLTVIRKEMPDYGILFDKIDKSAEKAVMEKSDGKE